jgi:signal peptidase I
MSPTRRLAETAVLLCCTLLLLHGFVVALYQVPGGSMAPALHGRHRACTCPRCGYPVQVGHGRGRSFHNAACPNCDFRPLPLDDADQPGDHLLVWQHAFLWWPPARWEVVVYRWLGRLFIKRVVGLPGETVALRGGDVYVNGELARKTLAECRAVRVPVFDSDFVPPQTWRERWLPAADFSGEHPLRGTELHLDGTHDDAWQLVTYRYFSLDTQKELPIGDEYAYNGSEPVHPNPVHDFLVELEVGVQSPSGTLRLGLTDGQDVVVAELAIDDTTGKRSRLRVEGAEGHRLPLQPGPALLRSGATHRLEFAFVDRRVTLAIDGREPFAALDLPPATRRVPVSRPLVLGVQGARVVVRHLRLYRDLHYSEPDAAHNAVRGQVVRLGPDQYFVLGDNSPLSEDSRFGPDGGAVAAGQLFGKPLWLPERRR